MNKKKFGVLLTLGFLLLIVMVAPYMGEESKGCIKCHSGFKPFTIELVGPVEVLLDETFEISVVITNNEDNENSNDDDDDGFPYDVKDVTAELNLSSTDNLELLEGKYSLSGSNIAPGESSTLTWKFKAINPGKTIIICDVTATVYHKHSSDNPDSYIYTVESFEHIINVKSLPLHLSTYSITATAGEEKSFEIIITTDEDITELTFTPSLEIVPFVNLSFVEDDSNFTSLEKENYKILILEIYSKKGGFSGVLDVSWVNSTGTIENISISINILEKPSSGAESINWFSISGRLSGLLLLGLLIFSIVLGGFPPSVKKHLKKLGKKRVVLHCQVSYLIVAISIFHLSVLIAGPWGSNLKDKGLILGFISLGLFIGLGIHGVLQRKFIKRFRAKKWRWIHRFLTIGVIVMLLIHAIMIGTEFSFLR